MPQISGQWRWGVLAIERGYWDIFKPILCFSWPSCPLESQHLHYPLLTHGHLWFPLSYSWKAYTHSHILCLSLIPSHLVYILLSYLFYTLDHNFHSFSTGVPEINLNFYLSLCLSLPISPSVSLSSPSPSISPYLTHQIPPLPQALSLFLRTIFSHPPFLLTPVQDDILVS